ncbi:hypothetical protein [Phycicoccus duodecadis]|uniref:Uncharacterized protein n=1 Tax=Phycicoccus duodecadis TaxID=173053 RepID=A0A2N3YL72_9MICO|nr:hypothetical protein [Phycicoccus duodecadis]PKW27615.1 hypothetical protein ATL31_2465 [Phycicoccus duodecadis]
MLERTGERYLGRFTTLEAFIMSLPEDERRRAARCFSWASRDLGGFTADYPDDELRAREVEALQVWTEHHFRVVSAGDDAYDVYRRARPLDG